MSRLMPFALSTLLLGACFGAPPASPTLTDAPATATPQVTDAPTTSSPPAAADWPRVPEDDVEGLPPIARLVLADGTVQAGELGSFSYRGGSADTPWIARGLERLDASAGQQLTVGLLPGNAFAGWRVSYAAADDTTGDMILPLATGNGDGLEWASFAPPPAGEWVIQVGLDFPHDDGDAVYYWLVDVP